MSSRSKQKGSAFEREIVAYLNENGFIHAERRLAGDQFDKGDITGTPGLVWECKNQKRMDLAGWVDEALVERDNAKAAYGAVIHKRRGTTNCGDYYVTVTLRQWIDLLKEAGW